MRWEEMIRVLGREDKPDWREALARMYGAILGDGGEVATAVDGAAAERLLQKRPVDVLSLDLNLSEGRSRGEHGPLKCDSGRLQLIELAARNHWAKSIILITRSDGGDEGRFVTCDEGKLNEATVSPDEFLRRRFGDRGLVLNKPLRWDLPTSLAHFEQLIRRRLPNLSRTSCTLRFGGTIHDPRVTIEADRRPIAALIGNDAMLLSALATLAPRVNSSAINPSWKSIAAEQASTRSTLRPRRASLSARSTACAAACENTASTTAPCSAGFAGPTQPASPIPPEPGASTGRSSLKECRASTRAVAAA